MATTFIGPDGYEYSATTPRQDPRSRGTQSINPLGEVMAILGAMQGNRTPRYASDAIQATAAANAGLFPLRQDPRKTARINERRREMNVTEQRGRTQGQRRRDAVYRQQAIDANKAKTKARAERAAARAEQERIDANRRYQDTVGPSDAMISAERDARSAAAAASQRAMEDRVVGGMTPDEATLAAQDIIADYDRNVAELSAGGDVIPAADWDIAYPEFAAREAGIAPPSPTMRDLGYVPLGDASRQAHLDLYRSRPPAGQRDGGPYSDQLPDGGPYSTDLNPLAQLPNYKTGQTLADYDLQQTVPLQGPPSPPPPNYGTGQTLADYDIAMAKPYGKYDPDPFLYPREYLEPGATDHDLFPLPPVSWTSEQAKQAMADIGEGITNASIDAKFRQLDELERRRAYTLGMAAQRDPRNSLTPAQAQQMQLDIDRGRMMHRFNQSQPLPPVLAPQVPASSPPYFLQANPLHSIPVPRTNYFGGVPMQIPMAPRPGMTLGGGY